jgi:hypothetical protein
LTILKVFPTYCPFGGNQVESIEIRKTQIHYPYTTEQFQDPDPTPYLDEDGNDMRFGYYLYGKYCRHNSYIISLKKSGEWNLMSNFEKKMADQVVSK